MPGRRELAMALQVEISDPGWLASYSLHVVALDPG